MRATWCNSLAVIVVPYAVRAQDLVADSPNGLGRCSTGSVDSTTWSRLVENPDVSPRLARGLAMPLPPVELRDKDGNYQGRIVLSLMVDSFGARGVRPLP